MALAIERTADFASAVGSPSDDTEYDEFKFEFKSEGIKIIVTAGTLDVSLNRTELHFSLPVGQYDFVGMHVPQLFLRQTGATAQVLAWAGE